MRAEKTVRELRDALAWAAKIATPDSPEGEAGLRMVKTHAMLLTWVLGEDAPGVPELVAGLVHEVAVQREGN